ncbi:MULTISPECIES: hypothetical protein [Flavobacterium]|jgi:hypothetical protein|uniref:Holin-X, holin superfamily III n=2 Tax=Flavobacterium TaxID=237 RepID=A0A941B3E3_9FLAO|nr:MULTISPECIES: hypothetical protein [Flavobacterium]MBP4138418.1 hypothetical protein [Flavobacterium geliluteum]MDX6181847.1 hypothetical protein [Flavobacterium sp. Fl-33]MDX6185119.1 hypothetical protein [Flavobacterium sp. Fl-77]UFH37227.1 hypothetical protein LNP22_10825 [Flavobacterium sp. F-70]
METNATTSENLNIFEKAENYTRTSLELVKLRTVAASADVLSTLISKIAVFAVVAIFSMFLNVGLSLWIGSLLGAYYYGFFAMSFVYLIFAIVLYTNQHRWIKNPIGNMIISSLLNDKKNNSN